MTKTMPKETLPGQLVLVEWEDSRRPVSEWQYLDEINDPTVVRCQSVGWLVHDGDGVKALAPNIGDLAEGDSVQASGIIRIPSRCITNIVRLAKGKPI